MNAGSEAFYFDNIFFDGVLGVNDEDNNRFSMYPNPANNTVNIASTEAGSKLVAVYDVLGKLVINTELNTDTLDISRLTSGVYIVKITQGNATSTKKLVVK
ncbi:MAG: T9SS type A sorting domain-containing protein, partial [Flavobacteriaceae bacterium]|nr:T9SS type A sorting domain-containing protein [Flavobacteriaceae bacterium]